MPALPAVAIFGPTGVGKTAVAIALAQRLRDEGEDPVAISADAFQVYRGLEILTAAPSRDERALLEHRLVGFLPLDRTFSAGEYAELAHAEVDAAVAAGRRPLVVGGTGLYLRAALAQLDLRPPPDRAARERLNARLAAHGPERLHAELASRAPAAAQRVAPSDGVRVVRALELLDAGEEPPQRSEPNQLWTRDTRHPTLLAGLVMEREALKRRIDERVDAMLAAGVEDEVQRAEAAGASPTARKAHGFEDLLAGDVEAMRRRTKQFTRRQLTWMRKLPDVHVIDLTGRSPEEAAGELHALLRRGAG